MFKGQIYLPRVVAILFAVICISGCGAVSEYSKALVGKDAPETRVTMLDGSYVSLKDFRGHDTFIIFWANWCGKSRPAIEQFNDLARKYAGSTGATFLAVSVDKAENEAILKARIETQELHAIKHAFSGNDEFDETFIGLRGEYIPYVVVIDSTGIVRAVGDSPSIIEDYLQK